MYSRKTISKWWLVFVVAALFVFCLSCEARNEYAGTYVAYGEDVDEDAENYIDFKEDGQGLWVTEDEEVSFRWKVKGGAIRMHTKSGGVLIAEIKGDTLEIDIPGAKMISFKKGEIE